VRIGIASENYQVEHDAFTMNRSLDGIRIRTAVVLSRGEKVVVFAQEDAQHALPARVVWVRGAEPNAEGTVGLELTESFAPEMMRTNASHGSSRW
jgi:hypothetical protein